MDSTEVFAHGTYVLKEICAQNYAFIGNVASQEKKCSLRKTICTRSVHSLIGSFNSQEMCSHRKCVFVGIRKSELLPCPELQEFIFCFIFLLFYFRWLDTCT